MCVCVCVCVCVGGGVITGHKNCCEFLLTALFIISWHARSHIYAHINIFHLRGGGGRIF